MSSNNKNTKKWDRRSVCGVCVCACACFFFFPFSFFLYTLFKLFEVHSIWIHQIKREWFFSLALSSWAHVALASYHIFYRHLYVCPFSFFLLLSTHTLHSCTVEAIHFNTFQYIWMEKRAENVYTFHTKLYHSQNLCWNFLWNATGHRSVFSEKSRKWLSLCFELKLLACAVSNKILYGIVHFWPYTDAIWKSKNAVFCFL